MIEGYLKSLLLIGLSCTIINDGVINLRLQLVKDVEM